MKLIKIRGNSDKYMMIDDEDFEELSKFTWGTISQGVHRIRSYAIRTKYIGKIGDKYKKETIYAHREVMKAKKGQFIDHIDGNGLNNQKSNLRFCTRAENQHNSHGWLMRGLDSKSSRYKGVHLSKGVKKCWRMALKDGDKKFYCSRHCTEIEAAKAYDRLALKVFGSYAKINFPNDPINNSSLTKKVRSIL